MRVLLTTEMSFGEFCLNVFSSAKVLADNGGNAVEIPPGLRVTCVIQFRSGLSRRRRKLPQVTIIPFGWSKENLLFGYRIWVGETLVLVFSSVLVIVTTLLEKNWILYTNKLWLCTLESYTSFTRVWYAMLGTMRGKTRIFVLHVGPNQIIYLRRFFAWCATRMVLVSLQLSHSLISSMYMHF